MNNIGIMPFLLLGTILLVIYFLQILPAQKRAKKNSTSTMYEIYPSFWTGWGVLLIGGGGYLLFATSDPQVGYELLRAGGPQEAIRLMALLKNVSYGLLGFGLLLFGLGLAKSMFTLRTRE